MTRQSIWWRSAVLLLVANGALAEQPPADGSEEPPPESPAEEQAFSAEAAKYAVAIGRVLAATLGGVDDLDLSEGLDFEDDEEVPSHLLGEPAPDFTVTTLEEEPWRLSDHRGKIVVIDFWATWCGPCVRLMPQIDQLHRDLVGGEVVVVGVNAGDSGQEVREFLEKRDFAMPHLIDEENVANTAFACESLPMTVVIDAAGVVQQVHSGFSPTLGRELAAGIKRLQAGKDLYDPEAVRLAREERRAEAEAIRAAIGPVRAERLREVGFFPLDRDAYFDGRGSNVSTVAADGGMLQVIDTGNSIVLFVPGATEPELVQLQWPDEEVWDVIALDPIVTDEGLQFAAVGEEQGQYDSDEETAPGSIHLGLFDRDGECVWRRKAPVLGDWADADIVVGDLDRDGSPEVVALTEHYGRYRETAGEDYFHVLSAYSRSGDLLARRWFDGNDGVGVYLLDHADGVRILVNERDGGVLYRYEPDAE